MTFRKIFFVITASLLLLAPVVAQAASVSREDFKTFLETRDALQDERVQKMPEGQRLPAIATKNFKMKTGALQAILDRVESEGGEKGVAEKSKAAVEQALAGTALGSRIKEIRVDTSNPHVITYVTWVAEPSKLEEEAALIALKAGAADKVTSTFFLWAVDSAGKGMWQALITADRTERIREDRIADWAKTRYVRLFEVEEAKAAAPAAGGAPAAPAAPAAAAAAPKK